MTKVADRLIAVLNKINWLNRKETRALLHKHNIKEENALKWLCIQHFNRLVEKVGEIARCNRGVNNVPIMEEAVEAAVCSLALALLVEDGDVESVVDMFEHKLNKWQNNFEKEIT